MYLFLVLLPLQVMRFGPLGIPRDAALKLCVSLSKGISKLGFACNVQFASEPFELYAKVPEADPEGNWDSLQGFVNKFCFLASSQHKALIREMACPPQYARVAPGWFWWLCCFSFVRGAWVCLL